jgi:hypothetical protein
LFPPSLNSRVAIILIGERASTKYKHFLCVKNLSTSLDYNLHWACCIKNIGMKLFGKVASSQTFVLSSLSFFLPAMLPHIVHISKKIKSFLWA